MIHVLVLLFQSFTDLDPTAVPSLRIETGDIADYLIVGLEIDPRLLDLEESGLIRSKPLDLLSSVDDRQAALGNTLG